MEMGNHDSFTLTGVKPPGIKLNMSYDPNSGGVSATTISYTPGAADINYTESGGVLSGSGGGLDGWKVANWALFNSITESDANNWIEFSVDITTIGQMNAYYYQNYLDVAPYVYKDIKGDFSFWITVDSTNGGDAQRSPSIGFGRLDSGGTWNACCSMECIGWDANSCKRYAGCRTHSTGNLYDSGAVDYPQTIKISRVGELIKWEDSADSGETWNERVSRSLDVGNYVRLFIGFGGDGGAENKMWITKLNATYFEQ